MSKHIKVIVCSNSAIDYLEYPRTIEVFRSNLHFGDETYQDFVDLPAKEFYERIKKNPNDIPRTSYVSLDHMLETFERLEKEGYKDVLVITIAKPLSGLNDAIRQVSSEVNLNIVSYDSKTL